MQNRISDNASAYIVEEPDPENSRYAMIAVLYDGECIDTGFCDNVFSDFDEEVSNTLKNAIDCVYDEENMVKTISLYSSTFDFFLRDDEAGLHPPWRGTDIRYTRTDEQKKNRSGYLTANDWHYLDDEFEVFVLTDINDRKHERAKKAARSKQKDLTEQLITDLMEHYSVDRHVVEKAMTEFYPTGVSGIKGIERLVSFASTL